MIRRIIFFIIPFLSANMLIGQTESDGFSKLESKDYVGAQKIFTFLLKTDTRNASLFFGLGECYYYTGRADSAKISYQSGVDAGSSYQANYAGLGKLSLPANPSAAENYFKTVVKKSRKDAFAIVIIAKAYYEQTPKNLQEAGRYVDIAIGVDNTNASAYLLKGLLALESNNFSEASLQFDRAIYFDPKLTDAYLYQADILSRTKNLPGAIEMTNKAIELAPQYYPAYKHLGELYYANKKYPEAIKNYNIYFGHVPQDTDKTHLAYSLFFDKQHQEALDIIHQLAAKKPDDYVLYRLLGYISLEKKDYENGREYMDKFFELAPADNILADDYVNYGKLLGQSGNDSLAIVNYELALQKDSSQYQVMDELAKSHYKLKNFEKSLGYSSLYLDKKPGLLTSDYFTVGRSYYSIAGNEEAGLDSLRRLELYNTADSLFKQVETWSPSSYLGPFWRARVMAAIDKETTLGLAKPFYEKTLELIVNDPDKYKREISEIYSYMGFYYYVHEDNATSLEYWKKLLDIDPDSAKAQEAINALESGGKPPVTGDKQLKPPVTE